MCDGLEALMLRSTARNCKQLTHLQRMKQIIDPRSFYERFLGKRVSDNHWRLVTRTLEDNGLSVTDDNVIFYAKIRKLIHRTPVQFRDILACYQQAEKFLAIKGKKITGEEILRLLEQEGITPHKATLSRWFKSIGGFRRTRAYFPENLTPVLASAFIYKLTNTPNLGV